MRADIKEILDRWKVSIDLKGYKDLPTSDGYHMQGTFYVNGKKAIFCEDLGMGGDCDITILNKSNAKPLLDIKDELAKLKAYPGDKTIGHLPLGIDNIFYQMAEDICEKKELKKYSKKYVLIKFPNKEYKKGEFTAFTSKIDKSFIISIIKKMQEESLNEIIIWNIEYDWKTYTIEQLERLYEI